MSCVFTISSCKTEYKWLMKFEEIKFKNSQLAITSTHLFLWCRSHELRTCSWYCCCSVVTPASSCTSLILEGLLVVTACVLHLIIHTVAQPGVARAKWQRRRYGIVEWWTNGPDRFPKAGRTWAREGWRNWMRSGLILFIFSFYFFIMFFDFYFHFSNIMFILVNVTS